MFPMYFHIVISFWTWWCTSHTKHMIQSFRVLPTTHSIAGSKDNFLKVHPITFPLSFMRSKSVWDVMCKCEYWDWFSAVIFTFPQNSAVATTGDDVVVTASSDINNTTLTTQPTATVRTLFDFSTINSWLAAAFNSICLVTWTTLHLDKSSALSDEELFDVSFDHGKEVCFIASLLLTFLFWTCSKFAIATDKEDCNANEQRVVNLKMCETGWHFAYIISFKFIMYQLATFCLITEMFVVRGLLTHIICLKIAERAGHPVSGWNIRAKRQHETVWNLKTSIHVYVYMTIVRSTCFNSIHPQSHCYFFLS